MVLALNVFGLKTKLVMNNATVVYREKNSVSFFSKCHFFKSNRLTWKYKKKMEIKRSKPKNKKLETNRTCHNPCSHNRHRKNRRKKITKKKVYEPYNLYAREDSSVNSYPCLRYARRQSGPFHSRNDGCLNLLYVCEYVCVWFTYND